MIMSMNPYTFTYTQLEPEPELPMDYLDDNEAATRKRKITRSSLACLPCRSRHLKCDGLRPQCTRCAEDEKQCEYAQSRRGGLDRAALAERRKRLAGAAATARGGDITSASDTSPHAASTKRQSGGSNCSSHRRHTPHVVDDHLDSGMFLDDFMPPSNAISGMISPAPSPANDEDLAKDCLVDLFYKNLHRFHPFVFPKWHLIRMCEDSQRKAVYKPLIAVLRLIGHIYGCREWSVPLKAVVDESLSSASQSDPIMVQCRLLYSIVLFWHNFKAESKEQMDVAIRIALELEMYRLEFARQDGGGDDAIIAESWRRTWWTLYIVDGFYAGTLGTLNLSLVNVEATVELPCEEHEYESGQIPEPKTLQAFNYREFCPEDTGFSSFAYLIGAVRCAMEAIQIVPRIVTKEASRQVIQAADSIIDGWLLLLPKDRKEVMGKNGEIDELMFQAHLLVHVATIGLHRSLSDLKFSPVENISSCARDPPPNNPNPDLINVHTVRVLRSVEAQIRLLALPCRPFSHTPFATCMISEGTLALLSACSFLLKGTELSIARDQIRMTIGCLRTLGEIWPRTAQNVREIQAIARQALGFESSTSTPNSNTPSLAFTTSCSGGDNQSIGIAEDSETSINDYLPNAEDVDGACNWFNLGDLGQDFAWWGGPNDGGQQQGASGV